MREIEPLLLRGTEVARLLGVSRALAYRWMANGTLPTLRVPGARTVRVPNDALAKWITENTQAGRLNGARMSHSSEMGDE
jgi:excisionase family DNA binding protein